MHDLLIKSGRIVDGTGSAPFIGDVAISGDRIAPVGHLDGPARRTIDAAGLTITPGFVDIHTHYDGQALWDSALDPSFSCGVTTAIVGNCGVGFAPVWPGQHHRLIELMEGVEEIPGTALSDGLDWNWNSFEEYLGRIAEKPHSFDIGALLPHGPLRLYAKGDKVGTDKCASGEELRAMSA
jgi:N-acyl-D-aspartate/D-glutamate deacylase